MRPLALERLDEPQVVCFDAESHSRFFQDETDANKRAACFL